MLNVISCHFIPTVETRCAPPTVDPQVEYKVVQSGASIVCLDDAAKVDKFAELVKANRIPDVKAVITWAAEPSRSQKAAFKKGGCDLMTWAELMELGAKVSDEELDDRQALISPGHCCGLIYTSGTTGAPKAVMISHDNIIFESRSAMCVIPHIGAMAEQERIVSYLPLSHVAGMMVDIIMPICITAYKPAWTTCYFARPYDLKAGSIVDRLKAVQPTIFLGVPRVWEKVAEKLKAVGATIKGAKRTLANWAKNKGLQHQLNKQLGGSGEYPFMYGLADKIVLSGVKAKLGLDKCKFGFTGAAPITTETLSFFGKLGIQVNEVYGMSECTGATSFSNDSTHIWGSCGFAMPGCEVAILKENGDECPRAADIFDAPEIAQVRPSQCLSVYSLPCVSTRVPTSRFLRPFVFVECARVFPNARSGPEVRVLTSPPFSTCSGSNLLPGTTCHDGLPRTTAPRAGARGLHCLQVARGDQ